MDALKNLRVPGVVWTLLLIALAALIQANFDHATWYNLAMGLIVALLKALEVNLNEPIGHWLPPTEGLQAPSKARGPHRMLRWLLGG